MAEIVKMRHEDVEQVAAIEKENFSMPWKAKDFDYYTDRDGAVFLIARQDDRILGYIGLVVAADEADITNVSVSKNYRRQGIGKALVLKVFEEAEILGVRHIFLEVRAGNGPAIALYRNFGFEKIGLRKNYYQEPDEDAILMKKMIGER